MPVSMKERRVGVRFRERNEARKPSIERRMVVGPNRDVPFERSVASTVSVAVEYEVYLYR